MAVTFKYKMTVIERITSRFRKTPATQEAPKILTDLTFHARQKDELTKKEYRTGLPFDIKVSNGGFTLTREGPPFNEDQGIRVFLIDNQSLDRLYDVASRSNNVTPEIFYRFLKMYERKNGNLGRYLALNKHGTVNMDGERMRKGYTIIVKKVDHPTKEKYRIPDEARIKFTPEKGFEAQTTERVIPWFKDRSIDLTEATRNVAALNIKEPREQPGLRTFLKTGGFSDEEITQSFERQDVINGLFKPNNNTLIIKSLREGMGSVPASPVDASIYRNEEGILVARVTGKGGLNGISINGQMHVLNPDQKSLDVPLTEIDHSSLSFWFEADSGKHLRRALELRLNTVNTHVIAEFVAGIAEVPMLPFNPSAGITLASMTEEQKEAQRKAKEQLAEADRRRKLISEEAEMGMNIRLFEYGSGQSVNGQTAKAQTYQEGDEKRLSDMIEDLKRMKIITD